jgi:hypothetical protein
LITGRVIVLGNIPAVPVYLCNAVYLIDDIVLPEGAVAVKLQSTEWSAIHVDLDLQQNIVPGV